MEKSTGIGHILGNITVSKTGEIYVKIRELVTEGNKQWKSR